LSARDPERAAARDSAEGIRTYLRKHQSAALSQLAGWVRIPSIAAQSEHGPDLERSARWLAGALRNIGFTTEVVATGTTWAVVAEWIVDPALPTILVYSHHDVRHAKPAEWRETAPFEPVLRDGRLYGRGASDAKGQVVAHLFGLKAHLHAQEDGRPAVNLKFVVEGEEEQGSPHLASLLEARRDALSCDVIVFSDTLQWKAGDPAVVTSMRGMVSATLDVFGPHRDVHSGAASGAAPNPLTALVQILSQLHDADRRITLPGFYDSVEPLTDRRRRELDDLHFDEDVWLERTESRATVGEAGFTVRQRLWARPSLEILSLLAGDPEGVARAVIPAHASATLNVRTVPGQKVDEVAAQLRAFFAEHIPDGVAYELTVDQETGQEPYVTPDGPALDALVRAMEAGHGTETAGRMGNAGGGPAELLGRMLDAPILFVGTGLPEDHWHSSDESIDADMLLQGAATIAHLWCELATAVKPKKEEGR
jgi:acetylornithine deacetylase/succinyl-diaminopimelate desuccinylase-like protein